MLLLRTSDPSGSCFVRTDQLDGETDWKLRVAVERTQSLRNDGELLSVEGEVYADPPTKDIHTFIGTITLRSLPSAVLVQEEAEEDFTAVHRVEPLTAENMLWANTVLAAGSAVGLVVYTGKETRAVMNTSQPGTKTGLLDLEINRLAKVRFLFFLRGLEEWELMRVRVADSLRCHFRPFSHSCRAQRLPRMVVHLRLPIPHPLLLHHPHLVRLFSPREERAEADAPPARRLRVNLDMGKTVYAHQIMHDPEIPGTIVRTSTLPEELGRIEYLLSDKTGTLTQNGELSLLGVWESFADALGSQRWS